MDNEFLDNVLSYLYNLADWSKDKDAEKILSKDMIKKCKKFDEDILDFVQNQLIKKIITDFYAYNLFLVEFKKQIDIESRIILKELTNLSSEQDVISFYQNNQKVMPTIVDGYYKLHQESEEIQKQVIANVINKRFDKIFLNLYSSFFCVSLDYYKYVLPSNVILGLNLVELYKIGKNSEIIFAFLESEFEDQKSKDSFISYVLSNIYADVIINKKSDFSKIDLSFCFDGDLSKLKKIYNSNTFILSVFSCYIDLYKDKKWFNFEDIRDKVDFSQIKSIYLLDPLYKHPDDIIKNADDVYTIMGEINQNLVNMLIDLTYKRMSDDQIANFLSELFAGNVMFDFDDNSIFRKKDIPYVINLYKLLFVTYFYEYCNYTSDDLDENENELFNYLENDLSKREILDLFNDSEDEHTITMKVIQYMFSTEKDHFLAQKKIIDEKKFKKILDINPYMFLEYRRVLGTLLPCETTISTEVGNWVIGMISDIVESYSKLNNQDLFYSDISQMIKHQSASIPYRNINEIISFVITNVYENIITKKEFTKEDQFIVNFVEGKNPDIDVLIADDEFIGKLLINFFDINDGIFNDNQLKEKRKNTKKFHKIKYLSRIDPFSYIDQPVLDN